MNVLLLIVGLLIQSPATQSRTGVVTGQILSADGTPAMRVRVIAATVQEPGQPIGPTILASITETDGSGRYRLENILSGRYHIAAGFLDHPTYYPGVLSITGATGIAVTAGSVASGIDFRLAASAGVKVSGRVVLSPNPNAPPNSRAGLIGPGGFQETAVDPDGVFEFSRVRPGTYSLRFNFAFVSQTPTLPAIVVVDKDVTGIEVPVVIPPVEIFPVSDLHVRVVVEGGGPMPRISFMRTGAVGSSTTRTPSADGTILIALLEGDHPVFFDPLPPGYALKSLTYGAFDLLKSPMKFSGANSEELRITLGPDKPNAWVKVSGRLTGMVPGSVSSISMTPVGLPGATARMPTPVGGFNALTPRDVTMAIAPSAGFNVHINADGTFEVPAVLAGSYRVSIGARFQDVPGAYPAGRPADIDTTALMDVKNEDLTGIEFRIPAQKQVTGRVTVENGNPLPRFRLILAAPPLAPLTLYPAVQAGGIFRADLPEGEYRITAGGLPNGYSVKTLTYGSTNLLAEPLKVSPADSKDLQITFGAEVLTIQIGGRVLGPVAGSPAASSPSNSRRISLVGETQQEQLLGADGAFGFSKVLPDNYRVRLSLGSYSGDISIDANGSTDVKALTLVAVSGRVDVEGGGTLPSSFFVEARNTGRDSPSLTSSTLDENRESRVRGDGVFSIVLTGGEQEIRVADLPDNYVVRSIRYGSTDALDKLLRIAPNDLPAELRVTIGLRSAR